MRNLFLAVLLVGLTRASALPEAERRTPRAYQDTCFDLTFTLQLTEVAARQSASGRINQSKGPSRPHHAEAASSSNAASTKNN